MKISGASLFASMLLATAVHLYCDDGAMNDGAYGPEPLAGFKGKESVIRMVSERIELKFGKKTSDVDVRFVFRSTKPNVPARQLVGFPDMAAADKEAERRKSHSLADVEDIPLMGPIEQMQTFVDGKKVESELKYDFVKEEDGRWVPATQKDGNLAAWYCMWVDFPPDRDVVIERKYRVPSGIAVYDVYSLGYIIHTGGTWKGNIGHLEADVTLADGLKVSDLDWKYCYPKQQSWKILSPKRIFLVWEDFKPDLKNKGSIWLVTLPHHSKN